MKELDLLLLSIVLGIFLIIIVNLITQNQNQEKFVDNLFNSDYPNLSKNSIGPFDNLVLKPENSSWRHSPSNLPLYKPSTIYTPQGTPLPLKNQAKITSLSYDSNGPTVDGTDQTQKNMFMFAYNQCRPECCPSTFSCDRGCICTTEQQRHFINSRGTPQIKNTDYPGI